MDEQLTKIGRYVVLARLGSGGFATVYRVRDTNLDREVALKVMRPLLLSDPTFVERFRREARVVANLDHPNIVPIYDYGDIEDRLCLVMKLLPGGSLAERINQGPMPWDDVVRLTQQTATALDYAHERGLVHRDIKPENVLLGDDGSAVLADFGLVRALESGRLTTSLSGGVLGTPAYLAPEVWNGEPGTRFTDIYGLACLVFEMATGRQLYDAPTPPATMTLHFRPPHFPAAWPEGVPAGIDGVLRRALAHNPEERYPSAGAFARELAALKDDTLAGPYAALQAAIAAGKWQDAVALGERILDRAPGYRDTRRLLDEALEGRVEAERAAWAAQWQAEADSALAAGEWERALRAAQRWREFAPDNPAAAKSIAQAEQGLAPPPETEPVRVVDVPEEEEAAAEELPAGEVAAKGATDEPVIEKVIFESPEAEPSMSVAAGRESATTKPAVSPGRQLRRPEPVPARPAVVQPDGLWARLKARPALLGVGAVVLLVIVGAIAVLSGPPAVPEVTFEPTPLTPRESMLVGLGQPIERELGSGDVHSYSFELDVLQAGFVLVEAAPTGGLDAVLEVLDLSGNHLQSIDAASSGEAEWTILAPADRLVAVGGFDGGQGSYTLLVNPALAPGTSARSLSGTLGDEGALEVPFSGPAGATVIALTEAPSDLALELWNADDDSLLAEVDNTTGNEQGRYELPAEGNYLLKVRNLSGDAGPYSLTMLATSGVFQEVAVGDEVLGAFAAGTHFEYGLSLAPGQVVQLAATPDNEGNVVLQLFDDSGNELTGVNNEGGGAAETLTFAAPEGNDGLATVIKVSESDGVDYGHFTLQLAEGSPEDVAPPVAHFDNETLGLHFDYPPEWAAEVDDFDPYQVVVASNPDLIAQINSGDEGPFSGALTAFYVGDVTEIGNRPLVDVLRERPFFADLSTDEEAQAEVTQEPVALTVNGMEAATAIIEGNTPAGTRLTISYTLIRHEGRYVEMFAFTSTEEMAQYGEALQAILETVELRAPRGSVEEVIGLGTVTVGESAGGEVSSGTSHAWHLSAGAGEGMTIVVQPDAEFDAMVDVRDGDDQSILDGGPVDSAGSGGVERVEVIFPADGEYLIYILGYDGSTGPYTLTVETGGSSQQMELSPFEPAALTNPDGCDSNSNVAHVTALDRLTVQFGFCAPQPAFLAKIALPAFGIAPDEYVAQEGGAGALLAEPVGTGPYRFERWSRGTDLIFTRNDDYWGEPAKTQQLIFRWTEPAGRLAALQAGEVDGIDAPDNTDAVAHASGLQLVTRTGLNVAYLGMNRDFAPFDDPRVRLAVALGIDRQRLVDNFFPDGAEVAGYFTPCGVELGCAGEELPTFDPELSKLLLAEAGYPDGFIVNLYVRDVARPYLPRAGEVANDLEAQLRDNLGITAQIVVLPSVDFLNLVTGGSLEGLYLFGLVADTPHVSGFLGLLFSEDNAQFGSPYTEIAGPIAAARSSPDQVETGDLYTQANNAVRELVPAVPLAHAGNTIGYQGDVEFASASAMNVERFAWMRPGDRDTFVWMQNMEPASLYCADESDADSFRACAQVTETLYGYDEVGTTPVPLLAEGCEPAENLTVWTCSLRDGVRFHDGSPLEANDVVNAFAVGLDPGHPLHTGNGGSFAYFDLIWGLFGSG